MNPKFIFIVSNFLIVPFIFAQFSQAEWDSIKELSEQDHQLMMKKLGIEKLRPGPSGNPKDSNYANSDESKAKQYNKLPDPLVFNNGDSVKTPLEWEKRRLEIKEAFSREIYGRVPAGTPDVKWEKVSEKDTIIGKYEANVKNLIGHVDNSIYPEIEVNIKMTLILPAKINKPVPVIIEFVWDLPEHLRNVFSGGFSSEEIILGKGWGYAKLYPISIQADNGAGLGKGIIGLVNRGEPRELDDWGALRAWAWGASKTIDYFETDKYIDEKRIGIAGLSRYGKAAIVAMAYDERVAIGLVGSSGAGGTKILRRIFGEQVENLASSVEYHWFAPNFIKYAGSLTANDLPVDAHELIALCAPRPVFISTGDPQLEGPWVDARGMFLAAVYASPVYELLGRQGIGQTEYPPLEGKTIEGNLAFAQHSKGHTIGPNWPVFIKFASKYFEK
jgi:hypothetical protein